MNNRSMVGAELKQAVYSVSWHLQYEHECGVVARDECLRPMKWQRVKSNARRV
jgi:hypothetical protein